MGDDSGYSEDILLWFEELTGFQEENPDQVRSQILLDGEYLVSKVNDRRMRHGRLELPSLGELRRRVAALTRSHGQSNVAEMVGNVQDLHTDKRNEHALFQVASQFNLLEMVDPLVLPKYGVGIYEQDLTQGPACAIACGAGTIFRNYFVPLSSGQIGQSSADQIDCLEQVGLALGNQDQQLWEMQNGYALPSHDGLHAVAEQLRDADEATRDRLRQLLQVGIHWNTEVTLSPSGHSVTQLYASAMPVAYTTLATDAWAELACLVLEAAYEATMLAAILNREATGCDRVFLTLLGGGAFGNIRSWIFDALRRSMNVVRHAGLDIKIVSYGRSDRNVREFIASL